ncbi:MULTISPECIES: hypothetical protein [Pyrobaculum]|nr:hypothetical protein [Pyrobaculum arsenaticum]
MRRIAELILEARIRISYRIAWIMYLLNIRGDKSLPDIKRFYAKAMARRWCPKKDRAFCETAFYKLHSFDIARYLPHDDPVMLLTVALYDVERGDPNMSTLKEYLRNKSLPAELALLTGGIDVERMIQIAAGILKKLGEGNLELIAATWQMTAVRTRTIPPLEKTRDNVILQAILAEMEKRGYVSRKGDTYTLTEDGQKIAPEIYVAPELETLKRMRFVTPSFYVLLNTKTKTL